VYNKLLTLKNMKRLIKKTGLVLVSALALMMTIQATQAQAAGNYNGGSSNWGNNGGSYNQGGHNRSRHSGSNYGGGYGGGNYNGGYGGGGNWNNGNGNSWSSWRTSDHHGSHFSVTGYRPDARAIQADNIFTDSLRFRVDAYHYRNKMIDIYARVTDKKTGDYMNQVFHVRLSGSGQKNIRITGLDQGMQYAVKYRFRKASGGDYTKFSDSKYFFTKP